MWPATHNHATAVPPEWPTSIHAGHGAQARRSAVPPQAHGSRKVHWFKVACVAFLPFIPLVGPAMTCALTPWLSSRPLSRKGRWSSYGLGVFMAALSMSVWLRFDLAEFVVNGFRWPEPPESSPWGWVIGYSVGAIVLTWVYIGLIIHFCPAQNPRTPPGRIQPRRGPSPAPPYAEADPALGEGGIPLGRLGSSGPRSPSISSRPPSYSTLPRPHSSRQSHPESPHSAHTRAGSVHTDSSGMSDSDSGDDRRHGGPHHTYSHDEENYLLNIDPKYNAPRRAAGTGRTD